MQFADDSSFGHCPEKIGKKTIGDGYVGHQRYRNNRHIQLFALIDLEIESKMEGKRNFAMQKNGKTMNSGPLEPT